MPVLGDAVAGLMYWLDLVDDTTWYHSGEAATYTNWYGSEPNGVTEKCTVMKEETGAWHDVPCTYANYGHICELELS